MATVRIGKFNFDGKVWESVSDNAKNFIRSLLTYDPARRPSAEEALLIPWIAQVEETKIDAGKVS
jgi:serine/threonine protein kinase